MHFRHLRVTDKNPSLVGQHAFGLLSSCLLLILSCLSHPTQTLVAWSLLNHHHQLRVGLRALSFSKRPDSCWFCLCPRYLFLSFPSCCPTHLSLSAVDWLFLSHFRPMTWPCPSSLLLGRLLSPLMFFFISPLYNKHSPGQLKFLS